MATTNDKEFRVKLETLSVSQQRQVAALFVQRVLGLSNDVRIKAALDMAMRADISDAELAVVSQAANTARVESYAQCGRDSDWNTQAGLFWHGMRPCRFVSHVPAKLHQAMSPITKKPRRNMPSSTTS